MTPAQKKQIIIREQQQRVLAHQAKIRKAKMEQQRRAAAKQAQILAARNGQRVRTMATGNQTQTMPQRLRNVVPQRRQAPIK